MTDILNLNKEPLYTTPGGTVYLVPGPGAQAIEQIINAAWTEAQNNKADFTARLTSALSGFLDVTAAPHVTAGSVAIPSITEPTVDIPATQSAGDVITVFDTKRAEIVAELVSKYATFRSTYFPDEQNAYLAAEDWLKAAIADPSGLPVAVRAAILGDAEATVLADKVRAQDAAVAQFAARRFPLPPDVAASVVLQIEQKAQDEVAETARKLVALSVDLQKFNVEKLLGLRAEAMDAANKYIAALVSGQDIASKVVGVGYDAQSKLITSVASFYNARTQAADTVSKVAQYNNSIQLEAAAKNQQSDLALIEDKLKALLTDIDAMSRVITSLYNNLHVGSTMNTTLAGSIVQ
jgi:hypothetical protein